MDPLELATYVQAQVDQARMLLNEDEIKETMGELIPTIERFVERFDEAGVPAAIADIVFGTVQTTLLAMVRMDKAGRDDWSPS
jgi:hypothetical protein